MLTNKHTASQLLLQFFTKEKMPGSGTTLKEFLMQAGLRENGATDDVVQTARDVASILEVRRAFIGRVCAGGVGFLFLSTRPFFNPIWCFILKCI